MNVKKYTVNKNDAYSNRPKRYRPLYSVTEENLIQLLDYYFPNLKRGDIDSFLTSIKRTKIKLNELEYYAEQIYPHLYSIWNMLGKIPTQINILDYALESFVDYNWDNSEKEFARKKIIEKIRENKNTVPKYEHFKEYHSIHDISYYIIEEAFYDYSYCYEQENDEVGWAESSYYDEWEEEEPSWRESKYYNDMADWNDQSGEFWDDVL